MKVSTKLLIFGSAVIVLLAVVWAAPIYLAHRQLRQRLDYTLSEFVGSHCGPRPAFEATIIRRISTALRTATVQSLRSPVIASVSQLDCRNAILVDWIEAQPTPDSVELLSDDASSIYIAPIPEIYQKVNRRDAARFVLFQTTLELPPLAASQATAQDRLRVVLLRNGQRISAPAEISWLPPDAPTSRPSTASPPDSAPPSIP